MQELRMTEQPTSKIEVDRKFSFTFFCPYTTCTLSGMLKRFALMNSYIKTKLINQEIHKDHEDDSYIFGCPKANLSDDVIDRVTEFEIGINLSLFYMAGGH